MVVLRTTASYHPLHGVSDTRRQKEHLIMIIYIVQYLLTTFVMACQSKYDAACTANNAFIVTGCRAGKQRYHSYELYVDIQ